MFMKRHVPKYKRKKGHIQSNKWNTLFNSIRKED